MSESLRKDQVRRYSRQLLLPEIRPAGQLSLCRSSVLIVGAGGLGCPSATYLAGAGVGVIGIVDYDVIEVSNLHRQVAYKEKHCHHSKAMKLAEYLRALNSDITCNVHEEVLDKINAMKIIAAYDVILDATDNVATRYLLNDACILSRKPLVSGSALRFEGQLTIYGLKDGPCYRCLFPEPPPPETVTNCSDGGVLGPVPGVIGSLQALEAIKIVVGMEPAYLGKMLLFDGKNGTFKTIKLRSKLPSCLICGTNPSITELQDYALFCGSTATDKTPSLDILLAQKRISWKEYQTLVESRHPHVLLDVRPRLQNEICNLPQSYNIPLEELKDEIEKVKMLSQQQSKNIFVVCRRGNDSQLAVTFLETKLEDFNIKDIIGGLAKYAVDVDKEFPFY